jgi:hypothetical protein
MAEQNLDDRITRLKNFKYIDYEGVCRFHLFLVIIHWRVLLNNKTNFPRP